MDLGNCRNLVDAESLNLVKTAFETYRDICRASEQHEAKNRGPDLRVRHLGHAVMETLHTLGEKQKSPPFQTVRGFFVEGEELYPGAGFRELDHTQICVRSSAQILGCFHP
jgi:hypothetical protein